MSGPHDFALAGLIGWPVAQSRSPVIHNFWLGQHGIAGRYVLLPLMADRLAAALRGLPVLGYRGCNVTMPHKLGVLPLLDHIDPAARRIGAVNTIVVQEDGTLHGYNYDGVGFVQSIRDAKPDWQPDAGPALILGAGGAARAAVFGLVDKGAVVSILNRTPESARKLARRAGAKVARRDQLSKQKFDVVLNATSLGMHGAPPTPLLRPEELNARLVFDLVYNPIETPLIRQARAQSIPVIAGLEMFVHQGARQFEIWTGKPAPQADMLRVVLHALRQAAAHS